MAALDALVEGLIPENQAVTDLKELGILPSTSTSTRINPYTSDRNPLDPNTGMETTAILQGIQKLDEKITGGFAQIIAKLSNTPIRGGGENKSHQSIEMSTPYVNPTTTQAPSFFNRMGSMYRSVAERIAPATEAPAAAAAPAEEVIASEAPAAEAPATEAPAAAAAVGGATIPSVPGVKSGRPVPVKPVRPVSPVPVKSVGPVKPVASGTKSSNKLNKSAKNTTSSSTTTLQNPMTQITENVSTSSLSGGRRRKRTRKSRRPTRRRSSRHRHSRRH